MIFKKISLLPLFALLFVFFLTGRPASAEFKYRPALGVWFGPTAPVAVTNESVDGFLGGGIFHRGNLPVSNLFYNVDLSWLYFNSILENRMHMFPVVGSLMYRLPLDLPVNFLIKAGGGLNYVYIKPEKTGGWDPVVHFGSEFFFPAGKVVRIGLRLDFLWTLEKHLESSQRQVYKDGTYQTITGAQTDAFTVHMGLSVYFNFVK